MKQSLLILAALIGSVAFAQTKVNLATQATNPDFSTFQVTKPVTVGSSLPLTCASGQLYFLTVAPAGQNLYGCSSSAWVLLGDGNSGGTGGTGASLIFQLGDFMPPSTVSGNSVTFGSQCTPSTPCHVAPNHIPYTFTGFASITRTAGTATDTTLFYVTSAGVPTFSTGATNTYTCNNYVGGTACAVTLGSTWPANSYPIATCTVGSSGFTTCVDSRNILGNQTFLDGLGIYHWQNPTTGALEFDSLAKWRTINPNGTLLNSDCGGTVNTTGTGADTVAIPQPGLGSNPVQFQNGCGIWLINTASGIATYQTPSGILLNGTANGTLQLGPGSGTYLSTDGTQWRSMGGGGGSPGSVVAPLTLSSAAGPQLTITGASSSNFNDTRWMNDAGTAMLGGVGGSALVTHTELQNKGFLYFNDSAYLTIDPTNGNTVSSGIVSGLSVNIKPIVVTANATVSTGLTAVNATSAAVTVTMLASPANGDIYMVKNLKTSTQTVTVAAGSGKTIDGSASMVISAGTDLMLEYLSSLSEWVII